jgi:hypothetical protein
MGEPQRCLRSTCAFLVKTVFTAAALTCRLAMGPLVTASPAQVATTWQGGASRWKHAFAPANEPIHWREADGEPFTRT